MTIAVGQHLVSHTTVAATTLGPTSGVTTAASGSSFFVFVGWADATHTSPSSITDSKGNTYTQIGSTVLGSNPDVESALYYCQNGTGGSSHTWTVTFPDAKDVVIAFVVEITGGALSGILDQSPAGNDDTASPYTSTTTGTTAQANELALAFASTFTASGTEVLTWGNSFTALDAQGDATFFTGGSAYRILNATGTYQSSLTSSGAGTTEAICFLVTLKEAAVALASVSEPQYVEPRKVRAPRIDAWEPLPLLIAAVAIQPWGFSESAPPRAVRTPRLELAAPLPAPIPPPTLQGWGFSEPPPPRAATSPRIAQVSPQPALIPPPPVLRWGFDAPAVARKLLSPVIDAWGPLPDVSTPTQGAWGFSGGEQLVLIPPRIEGWGPLPAIPVATSSTAVDCQVPLPRKGARIIPDSWMPIGQIQAPPTPTLIGFDHPISRPARRSLGESWNPLQPIGSASVDCQSPDPRKLARILPDNWQPLGQLAVSLAPATLVEPQAPTNRALPRAIVGDWEPLPRIASLAGVAATGFETGSPLVPTRGRTPADNWEPFASLQAVAPSAFGYECASPLNPRPQAPKPDSWEPLSAIVLPPTVPSGFECSTFLPRKVRTPIIDAWEPLSSVTTPLVLLPSIDFVAPAPRWVRSIQFDSWTPIDGLNSPSFNFASTTAPVRPRVFADGWLPLAALVQAATARGIDTQAPLLRKLDRARVLDWGPLPSVATTAPIAIAVECQAPIPPQRRAIVVDAWEPLPALPGSILQSVAFSDSPLTARPNRAPVSDWSPLSSSAFVSVVFSAETQRVKITRSTVADWHPLPALIPPPPVLPWIEFASPPPQFVPARSWQGDSGSGWLTLLIQTSPFFPLPPAAQNGGYDTRVMRAPLTRNRRTIKAPRRP